MKHIHDQQPNKNRSKDGSYGELTSRQIGSMAKAGQLGGEMVKRMIAGVEQDMADGKVKPEELK
ncbi:small, acid-soluble spore protein, alpha/beta type [Vallitalea pronyensis]|nr:small, acid-soluble spore protein, alpha/beta type [Vallitalea pronyensis]